MVNSKHDIKDVAGKIVNNIFYESGSTDRPPVKDRNVLYSPPYLDFSDAGDIMTIGQPVYDTD